MRGTRFQQMRQGLTGILISGRKEVLVLRDDLKEFFNDLLKHLDLKKILLIDFLENEKSASDLIKYKNDAEDDILKIIEYESELIDAINVEDFYISESKDRITRKFNFNFDRIFEKGCYVEETEIINFRDEIIYQKSIIEEIINLKKQNNLSMDKKRDYFKNQISELERMRKFKVIFPKDLQSS